LRSVEKPDFLGWIVPFSIPLAFAIGAAITGLWRRISALSAEAHSLPVASGLIAGESIKKVLLAMLDHGRRPDCLTTDYRLAPLRAAKWQVLSELSN
jgi:hypothetical protein